MRWELLFRLLEHQYSTPGVEAGGNMDILDIITGRGGMTYTGRYYKELPAVEEAAKKPQLFDYEYVDVSEVRYQKLLANIITNDSATETVKTTSAIRFEPNTHVVLQDGKMYLITSVTVDKSKSKQAGAFAISPVGAEKVVRLFEVEDVWNIGGAHS